MEEIEIFKPGLAELQKLAERFKGLTIKGVDDVAGYATVKAGRKELAEMRILITKFGKGKRDEAIAWQKEVLRQERQHLDLITPVEEDLKAKLDAIDTVKKMQEREVLLPARKAMLAELEIVVEDEALLQMDEDGFSKFFTDQKMMKLEADARKRQAEEAEKRHAEEIEKAKAGAAEKAIADERERVEQENLRIAREALEKSAAIQAEQAKTEKNRKYKDWLKKNKVAPHELSTGDFKMERDGNTFILWKKVDEITIN